MIDVVASSLPAAHRCAPVVALVECRPSLASRVRLGGTAEFPAKFPRRNAGAAIVQVAVGIIRSTRIRLISVLVYFGRYFFTL